MLSEMCIVICGRSNVEVRLEVAGTGYRCSEWGFWRVLLL